MYLNNFGMTDRITIDNDFWTEDNFSFHHCVGWNGSSSDSGQYFNGFMADCVFGNYSWSLTWSYAAGDQFSPGGPGTCPTYEYGPEPKDFIECSDNCRNNNDEADV